MKNKNFRKFESFQVGFLGNNKPEIGRAIITIANILNIVIQNSNKNFRKFNKFPSGILRK